MRKLLSLTILVSGLEWNKYLMLSKKNRGSVVQCALQRCLFSPLSSLLPRVR